MCTDMGYIIHRALCALGQRVLSFRRDGAKTMDSNQAYVAHDGRCVGGGWGGWARVEILSMLATTISVM